MNSPGAKLGELVQEYLDWLTGTLPEFATSFGCHENRDKLEDLTLESFHERSVTGCKFLQRLRGIDKNKLNQGDSVTYEVLEEDLRSYAEGYRWVYHSLCNPVNLMENVPYTFHFLARYVRADDPDDLRHHLRRLKGVPELLLQQQALMSQAINKGTTLHKACMRVPIQEFGEHCKTKPEESVFFLPFRQTLLIQGVNDGKKEKRKLCSALATEAKVVISNQILPAMNKFLDFMRNGYVQKTRTKVGISSVPAGSDYYSACLRWHLSIQADPKQIHNLGLQEVGRIESTMYDVMAELGHHGNLKTFIRHLRNDASNFYSSDAECIMEVRKMIDEHIRPSLTPYFHSLPGDCLLTESEVRIAGGWYLPASRDNCHKGLMGICRPRTLAKHTLAPLVTHEFSHHVQRSRALSRKNLPLFRTERAVRYHAAPFDAPIYSAYIEGWACYVEKLGEEAGIYRNPLERLGRCSDEMLRAARLVIDTGIHLYGWSRQDAITYLEERICDPISDIEDEVDRYISWPAQSVAYKIGERKILELRDKAREALGDGFSIRDFHDVILSTGPVPMFTLERVVKDWVMAEKDLNMI